MAKKRQRNALSNQLRTIIKTSELSRYRIAKESGVDASQLHRFVNGNGRLTTDSLDKIGSVHPVEVDVRIISASNRDLEKMISEKRFREDLFYRLNIVPIRVPPLRERKDDIPLLTEHFLKRFSEKMGKPEIRIEREVFAVFGAYRWPGNVRELENLVERLVVMNRKDRIGVEDLPDLFRSGTEDLAGLEMLIPPDGISLEEVERALIVRALRTTHGNQTGAAKFLRISRNTLLYRMGKYGLRESS